MNELCLLNVQEPALNGTEEPSLFQLAGRKDKNRKECPRLKFTQTEEEVFHRFGEQVRITAI
jgi:hypothetical protein